MTSINGGNDPFINRIKFGNEQPKTVKVDKEIPQETQKTLNQLVEDFNNGKITAEEFKAQAEELAEKGGFKITIGSNIKGDPIEELPKIKDIEEALKQIQIAREAAEAMGDKPLLEKLNVMDKMYRAILDVLNSGMSAEEMSDKINMILSDFYEALNVNEMLDGYITNHENLLNYANQIGDEEGGKAIKEIIDLVARAQKIINDENMSSEEKKKALAELQEQIDKATSNPAYNKVLESYLGTLGGQLPETLPWGEIIKWALRIGFTAWQGYQALRGGCFNPGSGGSVTNCHNGELCYQGCGLNDPLQLHGCIGPG